MQRVRRRADPQPVSGAGSGREVEAVNPPAAAAGSRDELVQDCAQTLVDIFADYNTEFRAVTRRARQRFEDRDWHGSQRDAVERIELYEQVRHEHGRDDAQAPRRRGAGALALVEHQAPLRRDHRPAARQRVRRRPSSARSRARLFDTTGVDPAVEFVALDLDPLGSVTTHVETKVYVNRGSIELLVEELLADFRFRTPYRDFDRSVRMVTEELKASLEGGGERRTVERLEVIKEVFYQMTRAYLVGRISGPRLDAAVRGGAAQPGQRRGGGRDHARGRHGQRAVQLHPLVLPRRPRARRRGGEVPQVDPAAQAGERAVHRARPRQAGQDRALPRAVPAPADAPTTSSSSPPARRDW